MNDLLECAREFNRACELLEHGTGNQKPHGNRFGGTIRRAGFTRGIEHRIADRALGRSKTYRKVHSAGTRFMKKHKKIALLNRTRRRLTGGNLIFAAMNRK